MFRPIHIDSSQLLCACQGPFKGEIQNRFNLISEERVKKRTKQGKLDANQLKNIKGSYVTLKFRKFSRNISWPVDMNLQMSELMMSLPHNFPFILYTEMIKISYFSYGNVRLALIPLRIDAE